MNPGEKLARMIVELAELREAKTTVVKEYTDAIRQLEAEIKALAEDVKTGQARLFDWEEETDDV